MRNIRCKIFISVLLIALLLSSCRPAPIVIPTTTETLLTIPSSTNATELTQESSAVKTTTAAPVETSITPEIKPIKLPTLDQHQVEDLLEFKNETLYPSLEALPDIVNQNQDIEFIARESIDYPEFNVDSPEMALLFSQFGAKYNEILTREEAIADIEYLGELFVRAFGGINQFGGEARVQEFVQSMTAKIPAEGIPYLVFNDQLILETSFIYDGHYWLGYTHPSSHAPYIYLDDYLLEHYAPEDYIVRTPVYAQNLKLIKTESGAYVDSENGWEVDVEERWIKVVLGSKGELFYTYMDVNNFEKASLPETISYMNGEVKELVHSSIRIDEQNTFFGNQNQVLDNVYYIDFRGNMFRGDEIPGLDLMAEEALRYPYLIIDLRGNQGGSSDIANTLLNSIFARDWDFDVARYSAYPITEENAQNIYNSDFKVGTTHFILPTNPVRHTVVQNKLVIVLIDNNTSSAGEYFTSSIKSGDKVLLIGSNTRGLGSSMLGLLYKLPNSGLPLRLPEEFYYHNPLEFTPDRGFQPDIYAEDLDLDKLVRYLNGLEEGE
ncbi:MAG: S41 family peptidase [Eubacteriales bacterium]|nr:S41 family peptidase [Eubacteriales bacterium]